MNIVKKLMQLLVDIFFKIYFSFNGEPKFSRNLQKTIDLYKDDGFGKLFSIIRSWDAPYEIVERSVPASGKILDLGCGDGLLANYLAISSARRKILGIELSHDRVDIADKRIKNTSFKKGDVVKMDCPKSDVVILAHVLHHLPSRSDQEKVLLKIAKVLTKGKKLIILEIDNKPVMKYIFSFLTDAITVPILFEGRFFNMDFFYRPSDEWRDLIQNLGFDVKLKEVHKGMPFSHVLIEATKK